MKALIYIGLKPGVLDPQGRTIARSLNDLGFDEVENAYQGKVIELDINSEEKSREDIIERCEKMCQSLLANMVIEKYRIELVE